MKYEYTFVKIDTGTFVLPHEITEHRGVIHEYAEKGYRFVTMVPAYANGSGAVFAYDLVFEKCIPDEE